MLTLENYKNVFAAVGLVGVLLIASPTLGWFIHLPGGEKFSELWLLGPGYMAEDYPFNVTGGANYMVYVGVGNHMGSSSYYDVRVKFRNQNEPLPNITAGTPSSLPTLYTYRVFVGDGNSWEAPLTFSFSFISFLENQAVVGTIRINDVASSVDNSASWDVNSSGYYYQLFVELWIYSVEADGFRFHNRFVSNRLNMTASV
jgi:hypothetical protein